MQSTPSTRPALKLKRYLWACLLAALLAGCGGSVELVGELSENEANEVLGVLLNSSIAAQRVPTKNGISIQVDDARVAAAIDVLRDAGLPRQRRSRMGDIFKKENLISSPLEERARYLYALSQELETTLSQIDGVIAARVHVVLPERVSPGEPTMPSSASVFVKHKAGFGVEAVVPQIRSTVANSIPGLTEAKVSVVLVPAQVHAAREAERWDTVLSYRVDAGSAPGLRVLLFTLAAMMVVMLGALVFLLRSQLAGPKMRTALADALRTAQRRKGRS